MSLAVSGALDTTFELLPIDVDVHLAPEAAAAALRAEAHACFTSSPKVLSPKWFYDDRGCDLFELITQLDEYYPTRTERSILAHRARQIAVLTGADTVVELGSGTSEKTLLLLDAFHDLGLLRRFVPFDVAESTLRSAAAAIAGRYDGVAVNAVVGDFQHHLGMLPKSGRRLICFLGGTIGNLAPAERHHLLTALAGNMQIGDSLLLGADLVKDHDRLVRAYDDPLGVTAAFNRNVLSVLNRELDAEFDLEAFDHVALFDPHHEWIEMRLRSIGDQRIRIGALGIEAFFRDGEEMRTEISAKFRLGGLRRELDEAGLDVIAQWTDGQSDFSLTLARR